MSFVIASRTFAFAIATIGSVAVLAPVRSDAQWWRSSPVDFESCADVAEKAKTKEDKTAALAECNQKYAGRRKPGGGYTYYDFMQDRTFDIAGPNPTPEEQKKIDEQYTAYLERERRNNIAAAQMARQQPEPPPAPQTEVQQVSLRTEVFTARDRKGACAGGEPGQASRAYQGGAMREESVLMRMAAALREHQRTEATVQPAATATGQAEEELDASVVPAQCQLRREQGRHQCACTSSCRDARAGAV